MAWIKISDEEARNHPFWDKFCWVRVLFLSVSLVVFIVLLNLFTEEDYRTLSIILDGYERSYWDLSEAISDTLFKVVVVWLWLLMIYQIIYNIYYAFNYKDIHSSIAFVLLVPSSIVAIIIASLSGELILFIYPIWCYLVYFIYKFIGSKDKVYRLQYNKEIQV